MAKAHMNQTALVKYDPSLRAAISLRQSQNENVEKVIPEKKQRFKRINTPLSPQQFIFAHIGILIMGLFFLAGLYLILNTEQTEYNSVTNYSPVTQKATTSQLEINNPEDELLSFSNTIVISGSTNPKSTVIIVNDGTNTTYDATEANTRGDFQKSISLKPGINMIAIHSFDLDGSSKSATRTVFYSEEALP